MALDVDEPVEKRKHRKGIGCADKHEGAAPQVLIDREPYVPKKAQPEADGCAGKHICHFPAPAELLAADEFSGEHTKHRRGHGGDVAQNSLRVEIAAIEDSQAEDAVHISHDISVLSQRAGGGIRRRDQSHQRPIAEQDGDCDDDPPTARATHK